MPSSVKDRINSFSELTYAAFEQRLYIFLKNKGPTISNKKRPSLKDIPFTMDNFDVYVLLSAGLTREDCEIELWRNESDINIDKADLSKWRGENKERRIKRTICDFYAQETAVDETEKHFRNVFPVLLQGCPSPGRLIGDFCDDLKTIVMRDRFLGLEEKGKLLDDAISDPYHFMAEAFVICMRRERGITKEIAKIDKRIRNATRDPASDEGQKLFGEMFRYIYNNCYALGVSSMGWVKDVKRPTCDLSAEDIIYFAKVAVSRRHEVARKNKDLKNLDSFVAWIPVEYLKYCSPIFFIALKLEVRALKGLLTHKLADVLIKYYFGSTEDFVFRSHSYSVWGKPIFRYVLNRTNTSGDSPENISKIVNEIIDEVNGNKTSKFFGEKGYHVEDIINYNRYYPENFATEENKSGNFSEAVRRLSNYRKFLDIRLEVDDRDTEEFGEDIMIKGRAESLVDLMSLIAPEFSGDEDLIKCRVGEMRISWQLAHGRKEPVEIMELD